MQQAIEKDISRWATDGHDMGLLPPSSSNYTLINEWGQTKKLRHSSFCLSLVQGGFPMFQQRFQRYWLRTFLVALLLVTVCMTTFFTIATRHHNAKASSVDPSFTVTYGDTYTFTDNIAASSSGSQLDLGNWTVTDTTTNTNLGALSGTISASQTGTYSFTDPATGNVTATYPMVTESAAIQAPSPLGSLNGSSTSFPNEPSYQSSAVYQDDIAKGYTDGGSSQEAMMGDSNDNMCPSSPGGPCDGIGVGSLRTLGLGVGGDAANIAMTDGITDEQEGYGSLSGQSASTIPTQSLARQSGGGFLAIQRPFIAPLALFAIGIAVSLAGLVVSNICNFRNASNPCSGNLKGALAIIGGIMTIAGGAVAGYSGAIYAGATTSTASAGQVAAGFEMTQTAMGEGIALLSAQLETIQGAIAPLANAGGSAGLAIAAV
jgi:hypothetical protein